MYTANVNHLREEGTNLRQNVTCLQTENHNLFAQCQDLNHALLMLQNKLTLFEESEIELKQKLSSLQKDNKALKNTLSDLSFTEDSFIDDDQKSRFYTGLPTFDVLNLVMQTLSSSGENNTTGPKKHLSDFQEILLVLIKLRLGLNELDLAYRFQISQSTVSRIFQKWITIMAKKLRFLIKWPSREDLIATLPQEFRKNFSKCVGIIDCTEIFIERPSDLKARAQTWSQYKHHNTLKLLIAISPQGTISYISKAWGGRASDKHITENCGFLDRLLPGDLLLADRGFTIQESVGVYCAEVRIPPFTSGKKQLTRYEVDFTRKLAHVRIHVERIIGQLKKKYHILQTVFPIKMLSNIDSIVTTCCALCNLSESVVPFD